jgi:hypothetical protein
MEKYSIFSVWGNPIMQVEGILSTVEVNGVKTKCLLNEFNLLVFIETNSFSIRPLYYENIE